MTVVVAVLVVAAGGVYGARALSDHGKHQEPGPAAAPSAQTTRVKRADLSDSRTLPGVLGFGGQVTVKGSGKGVISRLPAPGSVVSRGKPLYWVDDEPVTVFFGDTPFFRALDKAGTTGRDVTVLVENLEALGYDIGPRPQRSAASREGSEAGDAGTELTTGVLAALKRWQHDTNQKTTGTLAPDRAVVLSGPSRVDAVKAQLGDPAIEEVLTLTSQEKTVTVEADAGSAGSIHQGDEVSIILPDTRTVPGKVGSIGTTVQGGDAVEAGAGTDTTPTLEVKVQPADADDVAKLDAASVRVVFTARTRENVLVVPVGALLALSEGGYALQRPGGKLVGVRTGLFAKGLVEVSGAGIEEGDVVVTAS
ncbi:efflux RND transporter periplasmic adaptor subunit [Streptomyces lancefieldiae]|uniref:Peptidoglycan-binding protein n=1 Tax=Streptomyces lancefieldiae TaxID=3075520 RepID=A0ABU3AW00_9ACTN|nr:hypothetical protein [Streptomyces sp. DSM 40712]MDT0614367.1 hypothetical protein [Streptomyces sp. DSM 40712]